MGGSVNAKTCLLVQFILLSLAGQDQKNPTSEPGYCLIQIDIEPVSPYSKIVDMSKNKRPAKPDLMFYYTKVERSLHYAGRLSTPIKKAPAWFRSLSCREVPAEEMLNPSYHTPAACQAIGAIPTRNVLPEKRDWRSISGFPLPLGFGWQAIIAFPLISCFFPIIFLLNPMVDYLELSLFYILHFC